MTAAFRLAVREDQRRRVLEHAVARRRGIVRALRPFAARGVVAVACAKQPPHARGWRLQKRDGWWWFVRAAG